MFKQIQIEEIRKLRIPNIVLSTKGRRRASADWRSGIQACFRKTADDFLNAKFQNMFI